MKKIQPTKENEKIISDVVAINLKEEMKQKATFAETLVNEINTNIALR